MDEARLGLLGLGDSSYSSIGSGLIGQVLETATGHLAAATAATAHDLAVVTWLYATCIHCYWGCSSVDYTSDRPACYHHCSDSSCTALWALELGKTSYSVCFTYRAGVLVVCFTIDYSGSLLYSHYYGLHSESEFFSVGDGYPSLQESWRYLQ